MSFSSKVLYSYVENINFFYADGITPGISKMFHSFSLTTIEITFLIVDFQISIFFFIKKSVFTFFFLFFPSVEGFQPCYYQWSIFSQKQSKGFLPRMRHRIRSR